MNRRLLHSMITVSLLAIPAPATTQSVRMLCDDWPKVVRKQNAERAEVPVIVGLTTSGELVHVFLAQSGLWTIMSAKANGETCLMTEGDLWTLSKLGYPMPGFGSW